MNRSLALVLLLVLIYFSVPVSIFAQETNKQNVLDVNLNYKDGHVTVVSVEKRQGYLPDNKNQPSEGYELTILGKNQEEIAKIVFNFPLNFTSPDPLPGQAGTGGKTLTEASYRITVADEASASSLVVKDSEGKVVAEQPLSAEKIAEQARKSQSKGFLGDLLDLISGFFVILINFVVSIWNFVKNLFKAILDFILGLF